MPNSPIVYISYSWSDLTPDVFRLAKDIRSIPGITVHDGNRDYNAGNDYANLLEASLMQADYFIRVISYDNYLDLSFHGGQTSLEDFWGHKLKLIEASFIDHLGYISANIDQPGGLVVNFKKNDYESALSTLLSQLKSNDELLLSFDFEEAGKQRNIVEITSGVNEKMIAYFSKHPMEIKKMNDRKFEEMVAEIFFGFGYEVELSQKTRDGGFDIIAFNNKEIKSMLLIECKRYNSKNVGVQVVRSLFGVHGTIKPTKSILATTAYFTKDATAFIETNKWDLEGRDFNGIINWIDKYKKIKNL